MAELGKNQARAKRRIKGKGKMIKEHKLVAKISAISQILRHKSRLVLTTNHAFWGKKEDKDLYIF